MTFRYDFGMLKRRIIPSFVILARSFQARFVWHWGQDGILHTDGESVGERQAFGCLASTSVNLHRNLHRDSFARSANSDAAEAPARCAIRKFLWPALAICRVAMVTWPSIQVWGSQKTKNAGDARGTSGIGTLGASFHQGYESTQPPEPVLNALLHNDCTGKVPVD